jgi:ribonuclease R
LIVHRLIKSQILPSSKYRVMSVEDLGTAGVMLSACEQRAVKSERQLVSIKKARFIEKQVGKELEGMVSSVTKFGIFVLLREFEVDGLIRMEKLGHGYEFDEDTLSLRSRRSGHSYSIGDPLLVRVESVDIDAGQINFELASTPVSKSTKTTGKENFKDRDRKSGKFDSSRRGSPKGDSRRSNNHPSRQKPEQRAEKKFARKPERVIEKPSEKSLEKKSGSSGRSLLDILRERQAQSRKQDSRGKPVPGKTQSGAGRKPDAVKLESKSEPDFKDKDKKPQKKLGFIGKSHGHKKKRR